MRDLNGSEAFEYATSPEMRLLIANHITWHSRRGILLARLKSVPKTSIVCNIPHGIFRNIAEFL